MDVGPCQVWDFEAACCDLAGVSPTVTGAAIEAATHVLWAATGRRFGECEVTLRPCRDECPESGYGAVWWGGGWPVTPALIGGIWYNLGCGGSCDGFCGCNTESRFTLPAPVNRITEITIDDEPLPTGSYALYDSRYVVRTDGGEWPRCQEPAVSGAGVWTATVVYGHPVPPLGLMAAAELTCEFVKACAPGLGDCVLPFRVVQLVRQGVTIRNLDAETLTKLPLSNQFIEAENPSGLRSRPRMSSPDRPRPRRLTT